MSSAWVFGLSSISIPRRLCLQESLAIALQQSANLWERRAATSLVRLWQKKGKQEEARALPGEIQGWLTERIDTADMTGAYEPGFGGGVPVFAGAFFRKCAATEG